MWMILGCLGMRGRQLLTRRGRLCFSGSRSSPDPECHQSLSEGLCSFTFSHALKKKDLRYEKFQPHTKVKRTCNEARTPVPDIQRLSFAATVGSSVPLFLFLCWRISKKIPDIMSSHLPVLQYALKKSLHLLLFSEHGAARSPSDRPP